MSAAAPWARTIGRGPALVLIHGWGLNADVWDETARALADRFRVTVLDLPGHGRSALGPSPYTLDRLADALAASVDGPAHWLGWSLGGLLCLRLAGRSPERVRSLILCCSSPCFVRAPGWSAALDATLLEQFARELETDGRGTLLRFLALMTQGSAQARAELRLLRERVFRHGEPSAHALRGGLAVLRGADLRAELAAGEIPTLMLLGENDRLVPAACGAAVQALRAEVAVEVIRGAAHAPFLSHQAEFTDAVAAFIQGSAAKPHGLR